MLNCIATKVSNAKKFKSTWGSAQSIARNLHVPKMEREFTKDNYKITIVL